MKTAMRKKSINNGSGMIDLRLAMDRATASSGHHSDPHDSGADGSETVAVGAAAAMTTAAATATALSTESDVKMPDSPRQLTMSLRSEAPLTESLMESSSSDMNRKDKGGSAHGGVAGRARRSSATMRSFLQRVMRSQSESHIRITPVPQRGRESTVVDYERDSTRACEVRASTEVSPATEMADGSGSGSGGSHDSDADQDDEVDDVDDQDGIAQMYGEADLMHASHYEQRRTQDAVGLCDVFLNSSLQMLQVQSDTKQRVRQLWTCAQRLRWENQLSDSGLELLHQELLNVMKALTVEKLEGARHIKSGYLTLVQAPPAAIAASLMQRGAAAATKSLLFGTNKATLDQRVWVTLSEEQCRIELVPARNEEHVPVAGLPEQQVTQTATPSAASGPTATSEPTSAMPGQPSLPPMNGAATFPGIGKFKLPTSISWLLSDPLQQQKDEEATWIGPTTIKLQSCQVRRLPPMAAMAGTTADPTSVRFQILVPNADPRVAVNMAPSTTPSAASGGGASASTSVVPDQTPSAVSSSASSYGIYVFEVVASEQTEAERARDDWIRAIDRVCMFHLYALESQLRDACYMLQYRDLLASNFPVRVPLTWLRNRLERMPATANSGSSGAVTAQQHALYQQQQQQRRSSRNLSMVQIVKDLERDRILVDHKLLISCLGRHRHQQPSVSDSADRSTTLQDGTTVVEHDSVSEIVKYLVSKAMAFARRTGASHKTHRPPAGKPPPSSSSASSCADSVGPSSPSSRLTKFTEARALAFVERVLRGSSRTQSGGDIYDAISFFCQQRNLSICPMSHDAHPVLLNVLEPHSHGEDDGDDEDDGQGEFVIEIEVAMQFKVVELPDITASTMTSPREWAVLEGTLVRQFTLGKLSEPGSVTVQYIPDPESPAE